MHIYTIPCSGFLTTRLHGRLRIYGFSFQKWYRVNGSWGGEWWKSMFMWDHSGEDHWASDPSRPVRPSLGEDETDYGSYPAFFGVIGRTIGDCSPTLRPLILAEMKSNIMRYHSRSPPPSSPCPGGSRIGLIHVVGNCIIVTGVLSPVNCYSYE